MVVGINGVYCGAVNGFCAWALVLSLGVPGVAGAQEWNTPEAKRIVARAIERRAAVRADSGLRDYRARAHGFVFFFGQLGEGLSEPPRLVKSDQLELEVYWKSPGASKQRIVGWRDRADLPTDITYHRDHLGIVTNNFGDRIGLGHNDEVRDVPHPLSAVGPELYDYALVDSSALRLPGRTVRVYAVSARPKDLEAARVVGTLYIDVDQAELVQFRFNFTRNAYVDDTLEDITIVLENGLWDSRFWLPRRQEIEIRRRTKWLDLPARGIIRGRWEIDSYQFNTGIADAVFRGGDIVAVPQAERDRYEWSKSLEAAVRDVADPALNFDLEEVRAQVKQLAGDRVLSGLATARLGASSISDLLRFNRVEGLALGVGGLWRPGGGNVELRLWGAYGLGDERFKGRASLRRRLGQLTISLFGQREAKDVGDDPVIAGVVNSLLAQEVGKDYADYYLVTGGGVSIRLDVASRTSVTLTLSGERSDSMPIVTSPASGMFRPNNTALGEGAFGLAKLAIERRGGDLSLGRGVSGGLFVERGFRAGRNYFRVRGVARVQAPVGTTDLVMRGWSGWGSENLPAHQSFVLGGRGTLVSEPFREWGGRYGALGRMEWRIPVPFPALPLGPFATTGNRIVMAPFLAAGWAGGSTLSPATWRETAGIRPVAGVAVEWFHGFLRTELGTSLRDRRFGITLDISRDLWPIL